MLSLYSSTYFLTALTLGREVEVCVSKSSYSGLVGGIIVLGILFLLSSALAVVYYR